MLLLITKNYQYVGQKSIKSIFLARRTKKDSAKGQNPPQELEEGPLSGPHLLVAMKIYTVQLLSNKSFKIFSLAVVIDLYICTISYLKINRTKLATFQAADCN